MAFWLPRWRPPQSMRLATSTGIFSPAWLAAPQRTDPSALRAVSFAIHPLSSMKTTTSGVVLDRPSPLPSARAWEAQRRALATAVRMTVKGRLSRPAVPGAGTSLDPVVPFSLGQVLLSPSKAWLKLRGFMSSVGVYFRIRTAFKKAQKLELHDQSRLHFSISRFQEEARTTFVEFCKLRARGDLKGMRELCTEDFQIILPTMVLKLGNLKGNWDGQISKVEVEKLRMAQLEHERVYEFAQIMVRFTGTQSLTLTTKDGAVVPNSDQIRKLDEYWIFERPLQNIAGSSWRLQGRGRKDNSGAAVPAPAPAAGAIAEPPK